jgi:CheY-like chemotaxis protein
LELNQRTEALQEKEAELQKVQRQVEALRANLEELQERLEAEQEERSQLEAALDELRRAAAGGAMRAEPKAAAKAATTASATGLKSTAPLRLAESKTPFGLSDADHKKGLARLRDASLLTVVHLEENKVCRDQVQRLLKQLPGVRYLNTLDVGDATKGGALLLAVNLLNRAHDPIAALARIVHRSEDTGIFAYCSEGKFGFLFGEATFFTSPFDVDACSSWLLSAFGTVQRLLVASNNIEMTSQLRNALTKIRCSASVALDFRQVLELVPLIQPEVVLVDLSLPRAEGLRLVSRLRNDEKTAGLPLGVILPEHQRVAEFRQNAARAAREGSLSVETIVQALARELDLAPPAASPESSGDAPGKAAPSSR